jgi:winged helix DNA-binding protein
MAEPERTLTRRELNRAVLARQMLLERADTSPPRALERMAGLQAQYAPSMYIGLWTRLVGFHRDQLTRALERRTVVQGTLMRSTIHLVSRQDYWPFAVAVGRARRAWWLRATRGATDPEGIERAAGRLRSRLAEGPIGRAELEEIAGKGSVVPIGLWVHMVRIPPSGTWDRRRADLFAGAEQWLGRDGSDISESDAIAHLVRRYLGGFGPASRKDIADFTGLPARDLGPVLDQMRLRRFRDEEGGELLDLPRAPLPPPDTPAPVRFLPTWDAALLVHARRTDILPERYRPLVFSTKTPHSLGTFLVDGVVAGAWRHEDRRVKIEEFEPLDRAIRKELREEAARLAELHR